jgi:hypothetical protein
MSDVRLVRVCTRSGAGHKQGAPTTIDIIEVDHNLYERSGYKHSCDKPFCGGIPASL